MAAMLSGRRGGVGCEEEVARARSLRMTSERLCLNATRLTEGVQMVRAASVSIRRSISITCIRGGADGLDPTEARRGIIRAKLADGRLPVDSIPRGVVGPSRGELCDGCGARVQPLGLVMKGVASLGQALRFHVDCFYLWEGECMTLSPPPANDAQARQSADARLGPL